MLRRNASRQTLCPHRRSRPCRLQVLTLLHRVLSKTRQRLHLPARTKPQRLTNSPWTPRSAVDWRAGALRAWQLAPSISSARSRHWKRRLLQLKHNAPGSWISHTTLNPPTAPSRQVDVAKMLHITALMRRRRQQQRSLSLMTDEPIELQLTAQYNDLNDRVLANQRILESSSAQIQATLYDRVHEVAPTQAENQELRTLIEDEMDHRNAALAMLIVYMWRDSVAELEQRINATTTTDVVHVQHACHHKCAQFAAQIVAKRHEATVLKRDLDAALADTTQDDAQRLARLEALGSQLSRVEAAAQEAHVARRREMATLLHFDAHVRELVRTLLAEA